MYRSAHTAQSLPDVERFLEMLNELNANSSAAVRELFAPDGDIFVTRAPGRLDVIGGIADYSGSLVLELPISEATLVALQRRANRIVRIVSISEDSPEPLVFEMSLNEFEREGSRISYNAAREYFQRNQRSKWAAYVAGAFLVLMRERDLVFSQGANFLVSSQVPQGKGVSSSAALEVSSMQAVAAAFDISIEPRDLALLCQKVENLVAGAPCGVMDQMTAVCGEENHLLALLCQPAEFRGMISIPDDVAFWGLDSGVRHSISGADYGSVRVGTFMGYRIIAELAGAGVEKRADVISIDDQRWNGYLSNVTPSEFEQHYAKCLPEQISGADFLDRYQGTTDSVTTISSDKVYAVRVPTAHAIYEHHRVRLFAETLSSEDCAQRLELLGELMYQSHASYSACGLGSGGTDRLVELVRAAGSAGGLYGAKITGGGSGGTVAVLGRHNARQSLDKVTEQYAHETGYQPYVFAGSSPGSAAFGYLKLVAQTA